MARLDRMAERASGLEVVATIVGAVLIDVVDLEGVTQVHAAVATAGHLLHAHEILGPPRQPPCHADECFRLGARASTGSSPQMTSFMPCSTMSSLVMVSVGR